MKSSTILLPERPGTTWEMRHDNGRSWCAHCGKGYNSHGAPEDEAAKHGVANDQRHLICPASDEAWEEYQNAVRRESADAFVAHFVSELQKLDPAIRAEVGRRIVHAIDGR